MSVLHFKRQSTQKLLRPIISNVNLMVVFKDRGHYNLCMHCIYQTKICTYT